MSIERSATVQDASSSCWHHHRPREREEAAAEGKRNPPFSPPDFQSRHHHHATLEGKWKEVIMLLYLDIFSVLGADANLRWVRRVQQEDEDEVHQGEGATPRWCDSTTRDDATQVGEDGHDNSKIKEEFSNKLMGIDFNSCNMTEE